MKTKELIEKYQELNRYNQVFRKWVNKYTKDIIESERGRQYLNEIDEIESEIAQLEAEPSKTEPAEYAIKGISNGGIEVVKHPAQRTEERKTIGEILKKNNLTVDLVHNKAMTDRVYKAMEEFASLRQIEASKEPTIAYNIGTQWIDKAEGKEPTKGADYETLFIKQFYNCEASINGKFIPAVTKDRFIQAMEEFASQSHREITQKPVNLGEELINFLYERDHNEELSKRNNKAAVEYYLKHRDDNIEKLPCGETGCINPHERLYRGCDICKYKKKA